MRVLWIKHINFDHPLALTVTPDDLTRDMVIYKRTLLVPSKYGDIQTTNMVKYWQCVQSIFSLNLDQTEYRRHE